MAESTSIPGAADQLKVSRAAAPLDEAHWEYAHALLFTGHMIDAADRRQPRFPASAETRARTAIREAIEGIAWARPGTTLGLAGGASGGDLLFHQCCEELGISSRVLLALPADAFEAESVAPAGPEWVRRFRALVAKAGPERLQVMKNKDGLFEGANDNIWQRANLWMIEEATAIAAEQALLALWDGQLGDGPGGTEHFLQVARQCGVRILPTIAMHALLGA
jgi:hypothetical protein